MTRALILSVVFVFCFVLLNVVEAQLSGCTSCPLKGCQSTAKFSRTCISIGGTYSEINNATLARNQTCCSNVVTPFTFSWTEDSTTCPSTAKTPKLDQLCTVLGGSQTCNATTGSARLTCTHALVPTPSKSLKSSVSNSLVASVSKSLKSSVSNSLLASFSKSVKATISPSKIAASVSPSRAASVSASVAVSVSPSRAVSVSASVAVSVSPSHVVSVSGTVLAVSGSASFGASPAVTPSVGSSSTVCLDCKTTGCTHFAIFQKKCTSIGATFSQVTTTTPNQICCANPTHPFTFSWTQTGTDCSATLKKTKLVNLCTGFAGTQSCNSSTGVLRLTCTHS